MYILAFLIGFLLPFQTGLNSRVTRVVGSAFLASMISFLVGFSLLFIITFFSDFGLYFNFSDTKIWYFLGGFLGVFGLSAAIFLFSRLGAVLPVILLILGQISSGIVIDVFGFFGLDIKSFSYLNLLGFILVVLGSTLVIYYKDKTQKIENAPILWLLAILVGFAFSIQTSINTNLANALNSSLKAALISFGTALITLFFINAFWFKNLKNLREIAVKKEPFYIYLGGVFGAFYIFAITIIAPLIGVANASALSLFGMVIGGVVIDWFGLFGVGKKPLTREQFFGIILLIFGIFSTI